MVLIYYKNKETGKVLSFVEAAFSTVEMAKEFSGTGIADYCYKCGQHFDWSDKVVIDELELKFEQEQEE